MSNLETFLVFFSAINLAEVSQTNAVIRSLTDIILLGATGDLARKYLWKGIFELYCKRSKPDELIHAYGAARVDISKGKSLLEETLTSRIQCDLNSKQDGLDCMKLKEEFIQHTKYYKLKKDEDYQIFCKGLDTKGAEMVGRIFYLSVPPFAYSTISRSIHTHCRPKIPNGKSYLRVIFEKPFGSDLDSAESLAIELEKYFEEEEIYRIDHYLGKTGVSQILNFRTRHQELYQHLWNRDHIKTIEIGLLETDDCQGRTEFYNQYGVIRDVMQNHMTELMALVGMDLPKSIDDKTDIYQHKLQFLNEIEPLHRYSALIGQYKDYKKHCEQSRGTSSPIDATTPTFAAVLIHSKKSKWHHVPIVMVSGKQLKERSAYVKIIFNSDFNVSPKNPQNSCTMKQLIFHIQGGELKTPALIISKTLPKISKFSNWLPLERKPEYLYNCPGNSYDVFVAQDSKDAYTMLINAVYLGQKEHFIGTSDLLASWRLWSPLINTLNTAPPVVYSRENLEILDFKISGKRLVFCHESSCLSDDTCQNEQTFNRYAKKSFRGSALVTGSKNTVVNNLARDMLQKAIHTVSSRGVFHMALSGGLTPLYLFEELVFLTPDFPWHVSHVWLVDERCCPSTHKTSNFNFIHEHLLKYIPIPSMNVHQMPISMKNGLCSPLDKGAEQYEARLKSFIGKTFLDYVLLGVGADGHTASLFPRTDSLLSKNGVVISESKNTEPKGLRMTLTFEVLNKAKAVGVLILGKKKAEVVRKIDILADDEVMEQLPISFLRLDSGDLTWYIDDEACKNN